MVKYSLSFVKENETEVIDAFRNIFDLKQIDKLTREFKDEEELKKYLLLGQNMSKEDINRKIRIVYRYNGNKEIPVAYSGMKKYFDQYYLRSKLLVLGKSDLSFLEKLADHYNERYSLGFNPQIQNIADINFYLAGVKKNYVVPSDSEFLDSALKDLFEKAAFKIDRKTGGHIENYKEFRDLSFFIYDYEMSKKSIEDISKSKGNQDCTDNKKLDLINRVVEETSVYTQLTFAGTEEPLNKKKIKRKQR